MDSPPGSDVASGFAPCRMEASRKAWL